MYPLSNQEALNTEINPTGTPQANQHRTSNCQVQRAKRDPHPCPVFIYRPGMAVIPGGGVPCTWSVSTSHHENRRGSGPVSSHHLRPTSSRKSAMRVHWSNEGTGTSTSCSAIRGERRTVREKRGGHEILGTSMTCSGRGKSKRASTATGWSTICGTGTSSVGNLGAPSASCSTVCFWTRSCAPGGSARLAGRIPGGRASVPAGRSASRALPPPPRWPSSVPVGLRTSRAPHHGCDAGLRPPLPGRSVPRVATTSAGVVHAASWRVQLRDRHPS